MTITTSSIEYGKNSELSQLIEGDCLRSDAKKISPIKNLNCILNEVNKLTTHFQNVDKDAFFRKYGRLMEIAKVEVLSPAVRALVHFWDPEYRCFSFGSIDLCPTIEEYGLLTEFPNDLYRIYSPLRSTRSSLSCQNCSESPTWKSLWKRMARFEMEDARVGKESEVEKLIALGIFWPCVVPKSDWFSKLGGRRCLCGV
ncbi:hypothetical protein D5086_002204 [Populus alba]|uniref:Uncharacterized protein n=1 Tax=Populus alba TaxID=43335 RepID=A0ACC4D2A1_POPAL